MPPFDAPPARIRLRNNPSGQWKLESEGTRQEGRDRLGGAAAAMELVGGARELQIKRRCVPACHKSNAGLDVDGGGELTARVAVALSWCADQEHVTEYS